MRVQLGTIRRMWPGNVVVGVFLCVGLLGPVSATPFVLAQQNPSISHEDHRIRHYAEEGVNIGQQHVDDLLLYPPLTEYHRYFSDEFRWSQGFTPDP